MKKPPSRPSPLILLLSRHKGVVFVLLLLGICSWEIWHYRIYQKIPMQYLSALTNKPILPIKKIDVIGVTSNNDKAVRQALGCSIGESTILCNISRAQQRIKDLPFVDGVTIHRRPQDSAIVVDVNQRNPYAVWQNHGHFSLINRDGQPIPDKGDNNEDGAFIAHLPLVVGYKANEGNNTVIDTISASPTLRAHVVAAIKVNDRRWDLLLQNGTHVFLPENKEAAALNYLADLDNKTALLDRPLAWIDLRLPDRVTIHKRDEQADAKQQDAASGKQNEPKQASEKNIPSPASSPKDNAPSHQGSKNDSSSLWQENQKQHIVKTDIITDP